MIKRPSSMRRLLIGIIVLTALFIANSPPAFAEAEQYARIGSWSIRYRDGKELNGCSARTRFTDETEVELLLLQNGDDDKTWGIIISNPRWSSWVGRASQHRLRLLTTKGWNGVFNVTENKQALYFADLSISFMESLAKAQSLLILDDRGRPLVSSPLSMKDSWDASKSVMDCVRDHPFKNHQATKMPTASSGTAFFIAQNTLLTNNHVVNECGSNIQVRYPDKAVYSATIVGSDETNDLALLRTELPSIATAGFRLQPRLGEAVATYGFPFAGVLSSSGNFTLGNVTSLTGMKDDTRFLQMSTPIQPGNSGGPLLDMSGNIVGVVVAQLNALAVMQAASSIPQNVNFAIQVPIVINFLSIKGVAPRLETAAPVQGAAPTDVADRAKQFTVQIYCEGASTKVSEARPAQKASTETDQNAREQEAKQFVLALQSQWSRANAEALAGLETIYASEVLYFGKIKTRDQVIKEKHAFAQKFPEREYRPKEPISASCNERICSVRGVLDFRSVEIVSPGVV
jgi:serine protease Do